jgi:hypothetical protein
MRKSIAAMSLSATLLGGSALGVTVFAPHLVGAAQTDTSGTDTTSTTGTTGSTPSTDSSTDSSTDARPSRADRVTEILQPLVDDGTLTEAQRDAVVTALQDAGPGIGGGFGHRAGHFFGVGLDAVAEAIGIDTDTLKTELQDSTIAEVAAAHDVDVQAVIDTLVANANARLDQAVADGDLSQERADTIKADLTEHITDFVNNGGPRLRGPGFGGPGFGGPGRPHRPAAPDWGDTGDSGDTTTTGS